MRRYVNRTCLAVLVSGFCLLGFDAAGGDAPAEKETLRYDGKPFEYWRTYLRTELKAERRIEALNALAAFGIRGHATSAATAIVDAIKDYGEDAYGYDSYGRAADPLTPEQKVIETAKEAIIKVGPTGFEIVLRNAKNRNVRRFTKIIHMVCPYERKYPLSKSTVRALLEYVQEDDIEIREFFVEVLGDAIQYSPPTKENVLSVLRAENDTASLVHVLTEMLLDERRSSHYADDIVEVLGPRAKVTASALVKARLRGNQIEDRVFKAIGAEPKELVPDIAEGLKSQSVEVRTRAAEWLAEMGAQAKPALQALLIGLKEGPKKQMDSGNPAAGFIGSTPMYGVPYQQSDKEEDAWLAELKTLRRIGADSQKLMPSLVRVLADHTRTCGCRLAIANTLGEIGPAARDALPALRVAAKESDAALREAATAAIKKIEDGKEQK